MSVDLIEFSTDADLKSTRKNKIFAKNSKNGLNWTPKAFTDFSMKTSDEFMNVAWEFEWDELEKQGVLGFTGTLKVSYLKDGDVYDEFKIDVALAADKKRVVKEIGSMEKCTRGDLLLIFKYDFNLKPIRSTSSESKGDSVVPVVEAKFNASELTDIALDVEGAKIHVSKKHLAVHSDYFRTLFFSDFKEKAMDEIPIVDVKYKDFITLLTNIYPKAPLPNDGNSEILLELADRFLMPGVTHLVEHHLCNNSAIRLTKMVYLADKYRMSTLLGKCVSIVLADSRDKCLDRVKVVKASDFYKELSDATKVKIYETVCSY